MSVETLVLDVGGGDDNGDDGGDDNGDDDVFFLVGDDNA